jgi:hypothetical protein
MYRAMIFLGLLALLFLALMVILLALVFLAALLGLLALFNLLSVVEVTPAGLGLGVERSRRVMPCLAEVVGVVDDIYRFPLVPF